MTKQASWEDMGHSLTEEISTDAPLLAQDLFGDHWPGTQTTSDVKAGQMISDAYMRGDRAFLTSLAQRGPQQFLRVWKSLGGTLPPQPGEPVDMTGQHA